jgi:hypothetical protein
MTRRSVRSSFLCGLLLAVSCAAAPSPARSRWEPPRVRLALEALNPRDRRSFVEGMGRWEDLREARLAIHRRHGLSAPRPDATVDPLPSQAVSSPLELLEGLLRGVVLGK